ncbi:hypothetical protein BCAL_0607 [Bifidobacterium callitrichos DSM 23973]|uniref:Uncharacterized protein n=1 Tax=Bifidobacterium callitrichos DSM 23973 TaxID=1437609 RepID=A0A087ABT5_9BIFI|nr:hypothetical protein BCAL_0607 [Bifidobacterium callitrichos DSM 23973]
MDAWASGLECPDWRSQRIRGR